MIAAMTAVAVALLLPAHASVIGSTPEDGATITEQPGSLSVVLNEAIIDVPGAEGGNALEITDAAGLYYGDGCTTVDGDTISLDAELGAAGDYTLAYQVVSADGHAVSGEIAFAFEPVDAVGGPDGAAAAPVCDTAAAPVETPSGTTPATAEPATSAPAETPSSSGEVAAPQTTATGPDEPESTDAPGVDPGTDSTGPWPTVAVFVLAILAALAFIAYRVNRRRKDRGNA
ncbi:methionine-rich copper-binding protein CopC [Agrococcus sp. UYP33]